MDDMELGRLLGRLTQQVEDLADSVTAAMATCVNREVCAQRHLGLGTASGDVLRRLDALEARDQERSAADTTGRWQWRTAWIAVPVAAVTGIVGWIIGR